MKLKQQPKQEKIMPSEMVRYSLYTIKKML